MLKGNTAMRSDRILIILTIVTFVLFAGLAGAGEKIIKMSTTTSTQASGLLDVLLPELEKDTGVKVKVIAKGTGAAIRDGIDGNVDVIFVHAKAREEQFVQGGYGLSLIHISEPTRLWSGSRMTSSA